MATTVQESGVSRAVHRGIAAQQAWVDPLGDQLQRLSGALVERGGRTGRQVKDFLNGVWLGHPLHPVLVTLPIGAWMMSAVLDLLGQRRAADRLVWTGVITAVPTALSGLADWQDQSGPPRRVGVVHAVLNSLSLTCFVGSGLARGAERRGLGVALSSAGLGLASAGAYLGGELVYALGTGVDRNAWAPEAEEFGVAARSSDVREGQLARGEVAVGGEKRPVVLFRRAGQVYAIGGVCSHLGGPLAEGRLIEARCVECPWHGSRFDLTDGRVVQGPAAFSQPVYETRERDGNVEVRQLR